MQLAVDFKLTFMLFHDGAISQSKALAGTFANILGGEERLEYPCQVLFGDSAAAGNGRVGKV
ncbi:hypothetical protein A3197_02625 [Candidatus Thiodiazotropha endoloripes]|nr:hypothetical protein A3197_02625 [Candidatus Thiodiazotropha endoloripes]